MTLPAPTVQNPYDTASGCAGKIAYPSAQAAHRAIQAQRRQRHKPKKAHVYRCPYCHQYHQARITEEPHHG